MISKQRLQELIEQGATIYEAKYHNINPVDLSQKIRCINYKYGMIAFEPSPKEKYLHHKYLKNLFETEEDARWELEMTATRTETLKMPKWEELQEMLKVDCSIYEIVKKYDIELVIEKNRYFPIQIKLYADNERFNWNLSKENYIEACKLCLRLFRGEEK